MRFSQVRKWALNAEGIAKTLPVVAPAARAGKRESESEAATPKASRRLSLAVGEAGANIQRKSESEAAIRSLRV